MTDPHTHSILIVGGPNSGKTVYAGQLFGRLSAGGSKLQLRSQPDDLSLFAEGYDRLSAGLAPDHTELTARDDVTLALEDAEGRPIDVVYPDYGGEQVRDMIDLRRVSDEWAERIRASTVWLFFVRLDHQSEPRDAVSSPPGPTLPASEGPSPEADAEPTHNDSTDAEGDPPVQKLADQARTVEALQLLLHVYGASTVAPLAAPPLVVVLSCWDEMDDAKPGDLPAHVLARRLPLVDAFVRANWRPEARAVYGLSAQGKAFKDDEPDADFIERGPEAMGFAVLPDGSEEKDLTVLLTDALGRI